MQISAIYGILKYSEPLHNCFQVHVQNPVIFTKIGKLSILRFKNHFLTYSALQNLVPPNLHAFASFSNTKYFQCFVLQLPKQIKLFKSLSKVCRNRQCTEPGFWLYLAKLCSRDKHCTTA